MRKTQSKNWKIFLKSHKSINLEVIFENQKNPFKANGQPHVLGYEGDAFPRRVGASRRSLQ